MILAAFCQSLLTFCGIADRAHTNSGNVSIMSSPKQYNQVHLHLDVKASTRSRPAGTCMYHCTAVPLNILHNMRA